MKKHPKVKGRVKLLRRRIIIIAVGFFIAICAYVLVHFVLKTQVGTLEFKNFAESKVGDFFNAKVHIRNVRLGLLNQVALTELEIDPDQTQDSPYKVRIGKVIFRYNPLQLLFRKLKAPVAVTLESPNISFQNEVFPYNLLKQINFGEGPNLISSLEIVGGSISYGIPALDSSLEIQEMEGSFKPLANGKIQANFSAVIGGFVKGSVEAQGENL